MTSPTPFFAESAGESDGEHYAENASCSDHSGDANKMVAPDHSPDAGNMVSAAVPSEELSEEKLVELTTKAMRAFEPLSSVLRYREADKWHTCDVMGMRAAVRAIWSEFAPILAEKERRIREMAMQALADDQQLTASLDRALAAEAERDALKAKLERAGEALKRIARMEAEPIGGTGFQTGLLALFQAAKREARSTSAAIRARGE